MNVNINYHLVSLIIAIPNLIIGIVSPYPINIHWILLLLDAAFQFIIIFLGIRFHTYMTYNAVPSGAYAHISLSIISVTFAIMGVTCKILGSIIALV